MRCARTNESLVYFSWTVEKIILVASVQDLEVRGVDCILRPWSGGRGLFEQAMSAPLFNSCEIDSVQVIPYISQRLKA